MAMFRRVDGAEAGPDALGILVPPGRRTLVILRPRALDYDLLPLAAGGENGAPGFAEIDHKEAPGMSQRLYRALEAVAAAGTGRVEAVPATGAAGWWVRVQAGPFTLLACRRVPGEAYQPAVLRTGTEAGSLAARLAAILFPAADGNQELYFNTRQFSR
jgi:hypothetical protein